MHSNFFINFWLIFAFHHSVLSLCHCTSFYSKFVLYLFQLYLGSPFSSWLFHCKAVIDMYFLMLNKIMCLALHKKGQNYIYCIYTKMWEAYTIIVYLQFVLLAFHKNDKTKVKTLTLVTAYYSLFILEVFVSYASSPTVIIHYTTE